MRHVELFVVGASVIVVLAYVCRLDGLHFLRHHLRVILLHVALAACAAGAGVNAYDGMLSLKDIAGLIAAFLWLWISFPSWRYGPPSHVTRPMID